jgi:hypothetical protein
MYPANQTKLCGTQGCCPTVSKAGDKVAIVDDDGGHVTLTKAQWEDLRTKMAKGEL